MIGFSFYLLMCLQPTSLSWHALSGQLHWSKYECGLEQLAHAELRNCRCEPFIAVLPQRGDDQ